MYSILQFLKAGYWDMTNMLYFIDRAYKADGCSRYSQLEIAHIDNILLV